MIWSNITVLEELHEYKKRPILCKNKYDDHLVPHRYDMLPLKNLEEVFGPHWILWPFPIRHQAKGKGLSYPEVPSLTMADINLVGKETSRAH